MYYVVMISVINVSELQAYVVVTVEQHQDDCGRRRKEEQTILGKGIGVETSTAVFDPDLHHLSAYIDGI
jgi:hypothetical protein